MTVLLVLTLIYVAILVITLASGLIAIFCFLNQARANLKAIAAGLKEVDTNVAPLSEALTAANNGLSLVQADLEKTAENLAIEEAEPTRSPPATLGA
ncbi:MAG TPA: hypothetical protein VLH17_11260 [Candidatus Binatia bacterium]|jgi:hypothetical protein|nr:hypothetical protein [Candidatus Binatia bacterium]